MADKTGKEIEELLEELTTEQLEAENQEEGKAAPVTEGQAASSEVEDLASEMGWSPKDKWRGDPSRWRTAPEFLKNTLEVNKRLSAEVRETKETVQRIARTSAAMAEREIQKRTEELNAQFEAYVEKGDKVGARRVSSEIDRVTAQPVGETNPLEEFIKRNAWYNNDPEATDLAWKTADMHARQGRDQATQLQRAEEMVRKRYPSLFRPAQEGADEPQPRPAEPKPKPKPQAAVNGPSTRTGNERPRQKGVADLPADAKRAGEDFVRRGRVVSLDEYAAEYWKEIA